MSDSGPSSRRRGVVSHWVPLVVTLTVATVGVAAWAWSQRHQEEDDDDYAGDEEDEHQQQQQQQRPYSDAAVDYGDNAAARSSSGGNGNNTISMTDAAGSNNAAGWGARLGALGRSSSPQQWVGNASKAVTAGLTAASAAVGGALASIREGDKDAYADHETWSEEVESRKGASAGAPAAAAAAATLGTSTGGAGGAGGAATPSASFSNHKRRKVAIVVSAEHFGGIDDDGFHEHASILSYIPRHNDFSRTRIFVLIYAPNYKEPAASSSSSSAQQQQQQQQPNSLSSSFSNIATDAAQSPKQEAKSAPSASSSPFGDAGYAALHAQALALVQKESEIMPFTTRNGHANILHLLEPDVVYLQESLSGDDGATVNQLQNWIRNDIVVVVGAESGYGGLADSESEAEKAAAKAPLKWWQREERVGRGRGVIVVDSTRVHEDWERRVQGKE